MYKLNSLLIKNRLIRLDQLRYLHKGVPIPRHSEIVICGGGVVGASVAYHLAARGITDVLLLEQGRISCGTTWHAAGLVGSMRKGSLMELSAYSRNLYKWMEENNYPTGFKQCGSVGIAASKNRLLEMRRTADSCRAKKLELVELSPKEVRDKCPWIKVDDIEGGYWVAEDGVASPSDVCSSLIKMAKEKGVQVMEGCRVERVVTSELSHSVTAVQTSMGTVQCNKFILCAGMWSRDLGALTSPRVNVPLQPTQHFYLITQPIDGFHPMTPVVRDADAQTYGREWSGGFLVGVFDKESLPVFPSGPPSDFQFQLFDHNWDHFQKHFVGVFNRFPFLEKAEIRLMTNGPESFTPDNQLLLGESPQVSGFYVAAGMNSSGIALAGGVGRTIAEMIVDGSASVDCSAMDIKRSFPHQSSRDFLWDRGHEIVGKIYTQHYPKQSEYTTGRCVGMSPLYGQHKWRGAVFGAINDHEVPLWYPASHQEVKTGNGTLGEPIWWERVQEEIKESRTGLSVCDLTGLWGSITISGYNVGNSLDGLFYGDIRSLPIGSLVQTGMLDNNGHYLTETILLSIANEKYQLIFPLETHTGVINWLRNRLAGKDVSLVDLSGDYVFLMLIGPKTDSALRNLKALPSHPGMFNVSMFGSSQETLTFRNPLLPSGNTFGCIHKQNAVLTYEGLLSEGARPMGYHALDVIRIEEGIPWWGHEVTTGHTPLTAGKSNQVLTQTKDFIGKSSLTRGSGVQRGDTLVHFALEGEEGGDWLWGGEPLYSGKSYVGSVTSAAPSAANSFKGLALLSPRALNQSLHVVNASKSYPVNIVKVL